MCVIAGFKSFKAPSPNTKSHHTVSAAAILITQWLHFFSPTVNGKSTCLCGHRLIASKTGSSWVNKALCNQYCWSVGTERCWSVDWSSVYIHFLFSRCWCQRRSNLTRKKWNKSIAQWDLSWLKKPWKGKGSDPCQTGARSRPSSLISVN